MIYFVNERRKIKNFICIIFVYSLVCVFVKNDGVWLYVYFVIKRLFVFVMIGIRLVGLVFNIFNMVDFVDKLEQLKFYRNLMIVKKI